MQQIKNTLKYIMQSILLMLISAGVFAHRNLEEKDSANSLFHLLTNAEHALAIVIGLGALVLLGLVIVIYLRETVTR